MSAAKALFDMLDVDNAAQSWVMPECAGASEALRKRLGIGEFAPKARKKK